METRDELHDLLGALPESDRNILLLRYIEGRSIREISDALGLNYERVKKHGQRALKKLAAPAGGKAEGGEEK